MAAKRRGRYCNLARAAAVCVATLLRASRVQAEDADPYRPPAPDETEETFGMAELGVGLLTLPTAEVCVERTQAGCSRGDTTLVLGGWPMFRRGPWAVGAGVELGLTPTTDTPRNDPPDLPRDHARRYLTIELTARYYLPFSDDVDGWLGVTGGMVVVNDTFQTERGLTEQALVGPRGTTILTEGATVGVGAGVVYMLTPTWVIGGLVKGSSWFLPDAPERNSIGDEASLRGWVMTVEFGVTLAYRSRLVF